MESLHPSEIENVIEVRDESEKALIQPRDTTESSDSTSTSETTSSESTTSTSESSTSTSESTTTSSETTSTSTSFSAESTTTYTSTSSSSSTTTTSLSTTTTTSIATSTTSAALAEWNYAGNNRAIVFGCCLIALFAGVMILHCALDRAKSKRIAARELLAASTVSKEPLVPTKDLSSDSVTDRSSMMFRDIASTDSRPHTPRTAQGPSQPLSQTTPDAAGTAADHTVGNFDRQRGSPV